MRKGRETGSGEGDKERRKGGMDGETGRKKEEGIRRGREESRGRKNGREE